MSWRWQTRLVVAFGAVGIFLMWGPVTPHWLGLIPLACCLYVGFRAVK